jgi:hypothetical protein
MSGALERSFDQWNKMLIDQQQWDVQRERSNQNFELQKMMLEEEAKDKALQRENLRLGMQAKEQQIALQQQQVDNLKAFQTPVEMSLYPIIGNDFAQSKDGREKMSMLFAEHGENVTISPADGVLMDGDRRIPIAPQEIANKLSMMDFINRGHRNMPDKILASKDQAMQKYNEASKQHNFYKKQPETRFQARTAQHKAEMNSAKAQVEKANRALEDSSLASFYGREAGDFEAGSAYFRRFGKVASDQVQWLENQAEKFRTLQNNHLASALKRKPDKPTTMYVVDNDPFSGTYKRVKRQYQVYPTTNQDELINNDGSEILVTTPTWMSDKQRGIGDDTKKGKTPTPMSQDQVRDNIRQKYQIALQSMTGVNEVTSAAVFEKRSTQEYIADRIGLMLEGEGASNPWGNAQVTADAIMTKMELLHGSTLDKAESYTDKFNAKAKELGQKLQTKSGIEELKKGDPRDVVIGRSKPGY